MILKCECSHAWQDKRYGKGKRVHNKCDSGGYRCVVCEKKNEK
jgi:hypothetical protein